MAFRKLLYLLAPLCLVLASAATARADIAPPPVPVPKVGAAVPGSAAMMIAGVAFAVAAVLAAVLLARKWRVPFGWILPLLLAATLLAWGYAQFSSARMTPRQVSTVLPRPGGVCAAGVSLAVVLTVLTLAVRARWPPFRIWPLGLVLAGAVLFATGCVTSYCAVKWQTHDEEVEKQNNRRRNRGGREPQPWRFEPVVKPTVPNSPPLPEKIHPPVAPLEAVAAAPAEAPQPKVDVEPVVALLELVIEADAESARKCLATIAEKIQTRELSAEQVAALKERLSGTLDKVLAGPADSELYADAALLATAWNDAAATAHVRTLAANEKAPAERRLAAIGVLASVDDSSVLPVVTKILAEPKAAPVSFRASAIAALARLERREAAETLLAAYPKLEPELRPTVLEVLSQRSAWAKLLVAEVAEKRIPPSALNTTQVLRMQQSGDAELTKLVTTHWGAVRTERSPERERVIKEMRSLLAKTPGDATRGQALFQKVCGQCHKLHGAGEEVGPDLTANGRASFEQLLSNVFDPSLVIGEAYQARTLVTDEGRVLTGLLVEDSDQRVVLRTQGGKLETVAREHVEQLVVSQLSLMPEGVEKQYTPEELADLFAFLTLDKPPGDPAAVRIPGTPVRKK